VSGDCADAYVLLAEDSSDPHTARDLYAQGLAAGERALGPAVLAEEAGRFWGDVRTRPYMRARFGLARCLADLGQHRDAIAHYRELLRLNPGDSLGARYLLLAALLRTGQDGDAQSLLAQFDEPTALWLYGGALAAFRREGDTPQARARLRAAVRANRHVPAYLTGDAERPPLLPETYALGSPEEAVIAVADLGDVWAATPGALDWVATQIPSKKKRKRRR
jgi:tetratricopeptide (TPR) repeat protein